jgi:hypothetical protein
MGPLFHRLRLLNEHRLPIHHMRSNHKLQQLLIHTHDRFPQQAASLIPLLPIISLSSAFGTQNVTGCLPLFTSFFPIRFFLSTLACSTPSPAITLGGVFGYPHIASPDSEIPEEGRDHYWPLLFPYLLDRPLPRNMYSLGRTASMGFYLMLLLVSYSQVTSYLFCLPTLTY